MKYFVSTLVLALLALPARAAVQWADPLGTRATIQSAAGGFLSYALSFVGVAGLIMIVYGGFSWMIAGGNAEKVKKAKDMIIYAIIGMIVIVVSYAVVNFIVSSLATAVQ
ncbi:MAG: hypothetical protein V1821_01745 [bacterium]